MGYPPYENGPTWPTIDDNDKELKINKDAVKKIIDDLEKNDLNKYTTQHGGTGLPDDLRTTVSQITQQDIGALAGSTKSGYPAGQKMWEILQRLNGENGFPVLYQNFVTSYARVIEALRTNAGLIDSADQNSQVPGTSDHNTGASSFAGNQSQT
jgi:predicted ArsR family transcriptional regulator